MYNLEQLRHLAFLPAISKCRYTRFPWQQILFGSTFRNVPSWIDRTGATCVMRAEPNNTERVDFPECTEPCPHRLIFQSVAG